MPYYEETYTPEQMKAIGDKAVEIMHRDGDYSV